VTFPISSTAEAFEGWRNRVGSQLPEDAVRVLESLQPFQRDDPSTDGLVYLQHLSNTDKHRVPHVAVFAPTKIAFEGSVRFAAEVDDGAPDQTIWGGPLAPGVVLLEWRTKNPLAEVQGSWSYDLQISVDGPAGPVPVGETMKQIGYYTMVVASQFASFFE
jgi:hypothetical protein